MQDALARPDLTGLDARNLVGRHRAEASRAAGNDPEVVRRVEQAPVAYVLSVDGASLARHAALVSAARRGRHALVRSSIVDGAHWLDVAAPDRPGLLAGVTGVLTAADLDIEQAIVATWNDGLALESFRLRDGTDLDIDRLAAAIDASAGTPLAAPPIPDAVITFDDVVSPWHTVCEVRAADKPGLLHALASGFAATPVSVHAARMQSEGALAVDRFELTDPTGRKLAPEDREAVIRYISGGVVTTRRRWRRARVQGAEAASRAGSPGSAPYGSTDRAARSCDEAL